ncbi:MAG: glycoside hydrolase family 15 protein [Planctomycetota bacterium]
MDSSIDFLCLPRFDSPAVFAALLDPDRGGRFRIAPVMATPRRKQLYLPDSNVLLSRFLAADGVAEISDFMPIAPPGKLHTLVRRVKTVRGEVAFRMICEPRFDYARSRHRVELGDGGALFIAANAGGITLRLRTEVPLRIAGGAVVAEFTLRTNQSRAFVLEQVDGDATDSPAAAASFVADAFKQTTNFWRAWIARSTYQGRWREIVNRSALTLKLLTSSEFGSIVAAPTFGLPEHLGGVRNWDYRYTWIRDASFTLYALMRLGYTAEAGDFIRWLGARCQDASAAGSLQTAYGIDGRRDLTEATLPHLRGYFGSVPVRIGNGAYRQQQLDIYGELMGAVYLYDRYGQPIAHDLWTDLTRLMDWVCEHWREDDEGIWEVRSGRQAFLHSRVMCWAALDRAIRLARRRSFPAPLGRWHDVRDQIYQDVFASFWDERRATFVQHRGGSSLDAAMLLMPLVKFLSPRDPRWLSTLRAIERSLVDDSLVYRYRIDDQTTDGLRGKEGTFSMCSFWYIECLAREGDVQQARFLFEKMLGYANHLGLFAEQLGPCGEHLGNFPQAFTHVALISAACALDRALESGA